ncbi:MAG TPA: hypothetical protein VE913_19420 [Longimicrobium sp.]|nr:hypothetical protein [Longimicrobium sp.]
MSKSTSSASTQSRDREFMDALDQIEVIVAGRALSTTDAAADPCATYKQVRKYLVIALPFVKKIPVYGSKIAMAIEAVMAVADHYCN